VWAPERAAHSGAGWMPSTNCPGFAVAVRVGISTRRWRRFALVLASVLLVEQLTGRARAADVEITANTSTGVNLDGFSGTTAHVAPGIMVSPAISATSQPWTLTNDGTLSGSNTVTFTKGGAVINNFGATTGSTTSAIILGTSGIGGLGTVTNAGTITGGAAGDTVLLYGGGTVTNLATGSITASNSSNAVSISGGTSRTVTNDGLISNTGASFATGILIQGAGATNTITNNATGRIIGGYNGIFSSATAALTLNNFGSITSTRGSAVEATLGGTLTNSGTIASTNSDGILTRNTASADITNSGTITGAVNAINFTAGGGGSVGATHTLRLQTGSVLNGTVLGGAGTDNLILNGTGTEAIAKFLNFETLSMQGSNWTLTGTGTFSTSTTVGSGRLSVNGQLTSPTVAVASGGTLGGQGSIVGSVTVANGGTLSGVAGQTLTMSSLVLNSGSIVNAALGMHGTPGLFDVGGNLILAGTLNVTDGGGYGAGVYRLFDYGGALTNNGLAVGSLPGGTTGVVQTAIANQINLVVNTPPIQFWNGTTTSPTGAIVGGPGTWTAGAVSNWTNVDGSSSDRWGGQFAVFQGTRGGTNGPVTVDGAAGAVSTTGMQFIGTGWSVAGDPITLMGTSGVTTIRVGDGSGAGAGDVASISSVLAGSSRLVKNDLGTLVLQGANTYTGGTTVDSGTLIVNGSIASSAVTVNDGGTLGGNGTIGATTVLAGGTVAPGNSIGTLKVAGNVSFGLGSIYQVEVNAAGQSDKIVAAGTATLNGGTVQVLAGAGNYAPATTYTILTANGGRGGAFDTVTSNLAFLDPTLSYDPTNVYLTLTRNSIDFAAIGGTRNQRAAGGGVEGLGWGHPIYGAVLQLDAPAARAAFDALSGEIHASAKGVMIEDSRFAREAAMDRLRDAFGAVGAVRSPVMTYVDGKPVAAAANTDRFAVWGRGFGSWGSLEGDGNAATIKRDIGGFFIGGDGLVTESVRLGVLGGYSRSTFQIGNRHSSGSSDNYHIGLYGGTNWGNLAFRSGAAYTWHDLSTSRSAAFPGFADMLTGNYSARTAQVFGEFGYRIDAGQTPVGALAFEPFANLAYVNLATDGFSEKGGAAALSGRGDISSISFTTLGLRASRQFTTGNDLNMAARGMLGWRHAYGDTTPLSTLAFAGGAPFAVAGVPIAQDAAVVEAGLDLNLSPTATLGLSYGGQFGNDLSDQTIRGTFGVKF
jgi:fibronectin-binding autotransporter adhesin